MVRSCLSHSRFKCVLLRSRTLWTTWENMELGPSVWWNRLVQDRFMVLRSLSGKFSLPTMKLSDEIAQRTPNRSCRSPKPESTDCTSDSLAESI